MIPTKGKTYEIDYWVNEQDTGDSYKGLATCTGDGAIDETEDGKLLYSFETIDGQWSMFAEEDIIREVTI